MGGTPTKFISEGVIKGDEITLTTKAEGGPDMSSDGPETRQVNEDEQFYAARRRVAQRNVVHPDSHSASLR